MTDGVKLYIHHCKRCNNDWSSKSENPKRCGRCKSPYWDKIHVNKKPVYCTDCNGEVAVELKDCPRYRARNRHSRVSPPTL